MELSGVHPHSSTKIVCIDSSHFIISSHPLKILLVDAVVEMKILDRTITSFMADLLMCPSHAGCMMAVVQRSLSLFTITLQFL